MFSQEEIAEIKSRGSKPDEVYEQVKNFERGFPYLELSKAATIGSGILKLKDEQIKSFTQLYQESLSRYKVVKFVPASGAASRMFKDLFAFLQDGSENESILIGQPKYKSIKTFFENLEKFAFYSDLQKVMESKGIDLKKSINENQYQLILKHILTDAGLEYGDLPKGLLKFHKYENENRTPVQEHMVEGAAYTKDHSGNVNLHFTVSPEHRAKFETHINESIGDLEHKFDVKYNISFSEQKSSTDTIAVDEDNKPFRNDDGSLLFRPAGHGALIENLNEIDADVVFIKNIDNVVPDHIKDTTFKYKMALGGLLIHFQSQIFEYIKRLTSSEDGELLDEVDHFLQEKLFVHTGDAVTFSTNKEKREYLLKKLNRPIRICGMVKNVGEPGGGPFWAKNPDGTISLQIVESSQADLKNESQKNIFTNATHFNPVDIACSLKDSKGTKFDLLKFRDPATGFITEKSKDGRELKAQELPGLWNGAMSDWNTIFLEVPIITFNPVKTVNDLLRPEHQNV